MSGGIGSLIVLVSRRTGDGMAAISGTPFHIAGEEIDRRLVRPSYHIDTGLAFTITDVDATMFFPLKHAMDNLLRVDVVTCHYVGRMHVTSCDGHTATLAMRIPRRD